MGVLQALNVTVLFEAEEPLSTDNGVRQFVLNAIQTSCRSARGACVVVAVYDETGERMLGYNVKGAPSEEMKGEIAALAEAKTA